MIDEHTKKTNIKKLEEKKIEAKKTFYDWSSEEAYGRWRAFQEAQDIINSCMSYSPYDL